jgi:hypothetical protein
VKASIEGAAEPPYRFIRGTPSREFKHAPPVTVIEQKCLNPFHPFCFRVLLMSQHRRNPQPPKPFRVAGLGKTPGHYQLRYAVIEGCQSRANPAMVNNDARIRKHLLKRHE